MASAMRRYVSRAHCSRGAAFSPELYIYIYIYGLLARGDARRDLVEVDEAAPRDVQPVEEVLDLLRGEAYCIE